MRTLLFIGALAALALATPVSAQGLEEIVVTASRLSEYDPTETPHVTLIKRADNLITEVVVICDTRDLSQRRSELKSTLRNLIRAAASDQAIDLGLGDEVVGAFDESMLDAVIQPDAKADTSRATLLIKTAVSPSDTFDAATGRIKTFVERTPKVGRTEVLLDNEWQLTLLGPQRYRADVAKLIADDARRMAAVFGEGYGVEVQGLQLPVSWYQAGPLDLALYIPYRLTVRPSHS
jgi:hypothetical protein